ncbi:IS66 family transposase [Sinorhizobium meliloti]|uniref:IS66 family transposase n=2 Tax=Sinorhizobium/Ensifer group TaxID=227292 RepID=UPI001F236AFA|nr:transposase [Sinorhizobium meliloti]
MIVSDDAGQFRVGNHALCWVHAERSLQKLMPATPLQVRKAETVRDLVWRFYRALKAQTKAPARPCRRIPADASGASSRLRTGYDDLDKLLARLCRRKDEPLNVFERSGIPLHTNASENDLRSFVTKRKISGGTMSRDGRVARDTMLGLMKTCRKLGLSFWQYLGDRIGLEGQAIPPLATLVATKA